MSAEHIIDLLTLTDRSPGHWTFKVDRHLCLGRPDAKHLSGGACTALLIEALMRHTGKPLIQSSTQFLKAPGVDELVDIKVESLTPGRSIDLGSVQMLVDQEPAARLSGSFGARKSSGTYNWSAMPHAPPPETCDPLPFVRADEGDLHTHLDVRLAEKPRDGTLRFWVRTPDRFVETAPVFLSVVADYLPEAIHFNLGKKAGATSLDNTVRLIRVVPTDWLLCDINLHTIENGLFHGQTRLFAQNGDLLAVGSQSGVVRQ